MGDFASKLGDPSTLEAAEDALVAIIRDGKVEESRKASEYVLDRHREVAGTATEKLPSKEDFERLGSVLEEIRDVLESGTARGLARVATGSSEGAGS